MIFTASIHCQSRAHCVSCRSDTSFRESLLRSGSVDKVDFDCPIGLRINIGLGDIIEKMAKPIAKALRVPCHDESGLLKKNSGCAKRRDKLNKLL